VLFPNLDPLPLPDTCLNPTCIYIFLLPRTGTVSTSGVYDPATGKLKVSVYRAANTFDMWTITLSLIDNRPFPTSTSVLNVVGDLLELDSQALTLSLKTALWDFPASRGLDTPPAKKRSGLDFANLRKKK
jgi:hypothetical protein